MYRLVWNIENFTNLRGEPLLSPDLELFNALKSSAYSHYICHNAVMNSCQLSITQGPSEIIAYVPNLKDKIQQTPSLQCSVSFLDFDGTPMIHKVCAVRETGSTSALWPQMDRIKFPNKTKYFPNNTLRVEFRIWLDIVKEPFLQPITMPLFAITRWDPNTKMVRKTIRPQITGFRAFNSHLKFVIKDAIWNDHTIEIKVNFGSKELAAVCLSTSMFGFRAKIKVSVLVASGKLIEFGNHDDQFTSAKRSSTFTLNATKDMFLCHSDKFLPSGTLSLVITCSFFGHFHTNSLVEESDIFSNFTTNNDSTVAEVSKPKADETDDETDDDGPGTMQENETIPPNTIIQSLQDILQEGYLSDFNLKVGERTFPVHKNILGARSKVFRSMFASEMKEAQDNCVDIKDVDADTLQRVLKFIYTDRLDEELDWADASSLYDAADFYALEPLKQGCSEILKDGLSTTSALGVLSLADLHRDGELKSAALDFISLHDNDIIGTKDWIKFEKDSGDLALETFRELYSRKMNG